MSAPGRTLVVTNDFGPRTGGIETFVTAVTARLDPGSVVVHTARQRDDAVFDADLGYPVVRDPTRVLLPTPSTASRVAATARAHGCDRVWFGAAAPLGLMAPALRRAGVERTVATTHGHEVWWASLPGTRSALRAIGERNDVVTYLGEYCRSRIAPALSPAARARMAQLTPGVDAAVFRPGAGGARVRARHGLNGRPVVVCVSRMVARKGQDALVRAWPSVRRRVPGAALLLVGDGPHRGEVERLARTHGVAADVVLAGRVPWRETPAYYDAGDVFAMPTRTRLGGLEPEALGICYLEAAAAGLPVVAGDSGGAPDAVLDGENGVVVDGTDTGLLADELTSLLTQPGTRARMGRLGRAWVAARWSWERQTGVLQQLLAGDTA